MATTASFSSGVLTEFGDTGAAAMAHSLLSPTSGSSFVATATTHSVMPLSDPHAGSAGLLAHPHA